MAKLTRAEARARRRERKLQEAIDKRTFREQIGSIKVNTFTKAIVLMITVVALIDLQLSYVLAFLGKIQIAEELSKQVCTTILGTVLVYMIRAYFDTKSEISNSTGSAVSEDTKSKLEAAIHEKVNPIINKISGDNDTLPSSGGSFATTHTPLPEDAIIEEAKLETPDSSDDASSVG